MPALPATKVYDELNYFNTASQGLYLGELDVLPSAASNEKDLFSRHSMDMASGIIIG